MLLGFTSANEIIIIATKINSYPDIDILTSQI